MIFFYKARLLLILVLFKILMSSHKSNQLSSRFHYALDINKGQLFFKFTIGNWCNHLASFVDTFCSHQKAAKVSIFSRNTRRALLQSDKRKEIGPIMFDLNKGFRILFIHSYTTY